MILKTGIRRQVYHKNLLHETLELVQQIQDELIELPYSYTAPRIRHLVRSIHTIQSGAVQVDLTDIQTLIQHLEKISELLDPKNIETEMLLQAYECLRLSLLDPSVTELYDTSSALATTEAVYTSSEKRPTHELQALGHLSTFAEENTSRILLTEVAQELENLDMVLVRTNGHELVQELITEAQVFLTFGELLGISGFVAIARTILATLETTPQAAYSIGQLALAGLRSTYEAILKTDFSLDATNQFPTTKVLTTKDKELLSIAPTRKISHQNYLSSPTTLVKSHKSASPIKLKTSQLFVWSAGNTIFILETDSVEDILIPEGDEMVSSRGQKFLHWREQMLPVYQVSQLLKEITPQQELRSREPLTGISPSDNNSEPMFILCQNQTTFALKPDIEYLITQPEIVIQPFGNENRLPSYLYGYTIWKERPIQVIDVVAFLADVNHTLNSQQMAHALFDDTAGSRNKTTQTATVKKPTVLVVDDSKTVRQIISLALEEAGYQILQAQDGQEALTQLRQNPKIGLVICDVEMPNLNGFEFLTHRLKDPMLTKIPVVMLSTCNTSQHRQLAMQLGASNYFTKPYIKQEFITALQEILGQNR
jgi:CheY-like chemotaxis protein